jgi:hypothetical protein
MKRNLRALIPDFHPRFESLLPTAIGESADVLWNRAQWSFRKTQYTFTADGTATKEMDTAIENILEVTYGTNNRVIFPKSSYEVNEIYNNVARTGDTSYIYSLHDADQDKLVIEFTPPVPSGETVTIKALKKMTYGDISTIPAKLHGIVMRGAKNFIERGSVLTPDFIVLLDDAVLKDKPIIHKRSSMGRDGYQANRVNEINSLKYGSGSDTDYPID